MSDAYDLIQDYETDESFEVFRYVPPGPVAAAFIRASDQTPFIMGPVGGGKTTACAFKRLASAALQPTCLDGIKRDKWVVVRSSYRDAEKSVLASWQQWFPKTYPGSSWTGGADRPVTHTLRFQLQDSRTGEYGAKIEAVTEFVGLGDQTIEAKMRGVEFTCAWMNEADTLGRNALSYLSQRLGRYPRKVLLPPNAPLLRMIIGDFNAPDMDNWIYEDFVENPKHGFKLYEQPSGRSAEAENLANLQDGYYDRMVASEEPWFVRRFVDNKFGFSRDGKPVYEEFNDTLHMVENIEPDPRLPLLIGMDAGLTPAAVFAQPGPDGQLRLVDEVVPGQGYGASRFAAEVLERILQRYPGVPWIRAWCDPAAQYGADREGGELAWVETVSSVLGFPVQIPAGGSNELGLRLDAVRHELVTTIDGHRPRMIVSRKGCPMIVRGFASAYRYRKRPDGAPSQWEPTPEKNKYSHPHDALQYVVLGHRGRQSVVTAGRSSAPGAPGASNGWGRAKSDFNVHRI